LIAEEVSMEIGTGPRAAFGAAAEFPGLAQPSLPISARLRSWLSRPPAGDDAVADLIRVHRSTHPRADSALIRQAYDVAAQAHRGQMRKSGEEYISHPLATARILAELGMDTTTLVAALLHDTVEDTSLTLEAIQDQFGPTVSHVVDGVTKLEKASWGAAAEAETVRKMMIAAAHDIRVLIVKLADRVHNMRTLHARSEASRTRIAKATLEVLVPLCDRLGIQVLKRELEDLVLFALHQQAYTDIDSYVHNRPEWNDVLDQVVSTTRAELRAAKIDAVVWPRPRHYYSIWKDTSENNYASPHDPPRVVAIVDGSPTDCYAALGIVHGTWRPLAGRFKDYIASPKNNLYRSLHTTVIGPGNLPVEIFIRTVGMHRTAEYGIVARYRFPRDASARAAEQDLDWLRRVVAWQDNAIHPEQFLAALRCDLAEGQIQVFTGDGRKLQLPAASTPVDVAYQLNSELGHRLVGANVNGRLVPLSSPLVDGDRVELIERDAADERFSGSGPSREWLTFVKTPHAQLQIGHWFANEDAPKVIHANKVKLGRAAIGLALRQEDRSLASDLPLVMLAADLGFEDLEALLLAVADQQVSAADVVARLINSVDEGPRGRSVA
jgi:GTP pyrophosphokinase